MKFLFVLSILVLSLSCDKQGTCDEWEYYDKCEPKTPTAVCTSTVYNKGPICGDQKKDADNGRVTVLLDNAEFKKTRHYVRRLVR